MLACVCGLRRISHCLADFLSPWDKLRHLLAGRTRVSLVEVCPGDQMEKGALHGRGPQAPPHHTHRHMRLHLSHLLAAALLAAALLPTVAKTLLTSHGPRRTHVCMCVGKGSRAKSLAKAQDIRGRRQRAPHWLPLSRRWRRASGRGPPNSVRTRYQNSRWGG